MAKNTIWSPDDNSTLEQSLFFVLSHRVVKIELRNPSSLGKQQGSLLIAFDDTRPLKKTCSLCLSSLYIDFGAFFGAFFIFTTFKEPVKLKIKYNKKIYEFESTI